MSHNSPTVDTSELRYVQNRLAYPKKTMQYLRVFLTRHRQYTCIISGWSHIPTSRHIYHRYGPDADQILIEIRAEVERESHALGEFDS
ncbi:hypothetical protein ACTXT7_007922 [Hymenolepis weldensis]